MKKLLLFILAITLTARAQIAGSIQYEGTMIARLGQSSSHILVGPIVMRTGPDSCDHCLLAFDGFVLLLDAQRDLMTSNYFAGTIPTASFQTGGRLRLTFSIGNDTGGTVRLKVGRRLPKVIGP